MIDEVGYMQLSRQQAELLFQIVCARYERGTIIMTSNKYFSDWGELMSDSVIATAILDRLLYHAHVINIRGESYRLKDRLRAGLNPAVPQPGLGKTGFKDFRPKAEETFEFTVLLGSLLTGQMGQIEPGP